MTTAKKTTKTRSTSTRKKSTTRRKTTATKPRTVSVKKKELPANPMVHELLEAVDAERVKAKKLEILRTHGEDSFKMTMIWNFDESVVSMLPEGSVPYQPVESDVQANREKGLPQRSTIRNSARQFYRFVKGGDDQLNKIKRESIFINILETLPPPEAEILVLVKDKALINRYNVNRGHVEEAYPDIQWGGRG